MEGDMEGDMEGVHTVPQVGWVAYEILVPAEPRGQIPWCFEKL